MLVPDTRNAAPRLGLSQVGGHGFPVVGHDGGPAGLMSRRQMRNLRVVVRAGYGNFDTADPTQQHCNRTLQEIYTWASTGMFSILSHNETWIQDPVRGPRILVFVRWQEYTERDAEAVAEMLM